jgi:hypothetical protein
MIWPYRAVAILLAAGLAAAAAQPRVPPSDLPGRERFRFTPLPEFMQPQPPPEPLIRRDCDARAATSRSRQRARRDRDC